jgi:hypothetical protein
MVSQRAVLFALALCLFISSPLCATTRTWTGAVSANWSNPTNWSPSGIPTAADSLVFPSGASHLSMTNDLPPGTSVGPMTFQGNVSYALSGNALTLMGDLNSQNSFFCSVDLKIGTAMTIFGSFQDRYFGAIDVNGQTLTMSAPDVPLVGPLNGTGTVLFALIGSVEGNGTFSGTLTGVMNVSGSLPNATVAGDAPTGGSGLSGAGTVGNVTVEGNRGYLSPGNEIFGRTTGVLHTKSLVLNSPHNGTMFDLAPGGSSDKVQVSGTVTLSGPLYVNIVSGAPTLGQTFTIIENDGNDPVSGTFSALPEGSNFPVGTSRFSITYRGGDGNDVVLTAVSAQKMWTGAVSALWSNPQNWSPQVIPLPGEQLLFPSGASNVSMTNDLPSGTSVGPMTFQGGASYALSGNALTLTGDVNSQNSFFCNVDLRIGTALTILGSFQDRYNGAIDVNGKTLTIGSPYIPLNGPINGTGTIFFALIGSVGGAGTFSGTLTGVMNVSGSLPNATVAGDTPSGGSGLSGAGTVGNVTVEGNRGYLSPGNELFGRAVGVLHTKTLVLNAPHNGTTFDLVPGGSSDQVQVSGTVTLSGPLTVSIVSGAPTPGQTFTIIDNDGSDPVSGTFSALPEGSAVASGPYRFRISYAGGDGNDVQLTATTETTAVLTQNVSSTRVGQPWTLTATVTSGFGTPTGSVAFSADGIGLGTAPLVNGIAALTASVASVGARTVVATVQGTGAYANSVSAGIAHVINRGQTNTVLASDHPNSLYGQTIHFTTSTSALAPATGQPTGSVTILADGLPLGTIPVVNGTATFQTSAFHSGTKSITATYSGDANFDASTPSAIQQNIAKAQTQVDARGRSPLFVGESLPITVFVNVTPVSSLVPSGAISISEGSAVLGTQILAGGAANLNLHSFAAGDHTLVVNYEGAADFEPSSETIVQSVVAPGLSIHGTRVLQGHRGMTTVSLVVTLSAPVSQTVRVSFSTVAGSATAGEDYESASGVIEFAPGEMTNAIELHVIGDTFPEPDETFSVLLSNPVNARIDTPSAVIVIVNDDQVPPRRRPSRH